jgi:short-subunit dehydrogenase
MTSKKFILITGVSTGIGYALLEHWANSGYHVIGTVRKQEDADRIQGRFPETTTILVFDVRDATSCEKKLTEAFHQLQVQRLTALVNNAGVAIPGPLQYLDEFDFEAQLDINVKAVRRITNYCLPYLGVQKNGMKSDPGRIIMISSVSGLFNSPYNGAYCISKHALESMVDVYRRELMPFGIKVISIQPGPVKTEIWRKSINTLDKYLNTEYGNIMQHANRLIENTEKSAMPVDQVVKLADKALKESNPPTRMLLHKKKWLFRILTYYLPDKWADKLVARALASGDKYRPV